MGDYVDTASPSNRRAYQIAETDLYDSFRDLVHHAVAAVVREGAGKLKVLICSNREEERRPHPRVLQAVTPGPRRGRGLHAHRGTDGEAHLPRRGRAPLQHRPEIILSPPAGPVRAFADMWRGWPEDQKTTIHYTQCPTLVANIREEIPPFDRQYWIGDAAFPQDAFLQEFCKSSIQATARPSPGCPERRS